MKAAAALALLCAACSIGSPAVTDFAGDMPSSILVLPPRAAPSMGRLVDVGDAAAGCDLALKARGYRTLPLELGFQVARNRGLVGGQEPAPRQLADLRQHGGMDAVLEILVADWNLAGTPSLQSASWDLEWIVRSAETGEALWRHHHSGSWRREIERPDLLQGWTDQPQPVEIGAPARAQFRTGRELALALHRMAFSRLPERRP